MPNPGQDFLKSLPTVAEVLVKCRNHRVRYYRPTVIVYDCSKIVVYAIIVQLQMYTTVAKLWCIPVSYTHLTLPTIYSV